MLNGVSVPLKQFAPFVAFITYDGMSRPLAGFVFQQITSVQIIETAGYAVHAGGNYIAYTRGAAIAQGYSVADITPVFIAAHFFITGSAAGKSF